MFTPGTPARLWVKRRIVAHDLPARKLSLRDFSSRCGQKSYSLRNFRNLPAL